MHSDLACEVWQELKRFVSPVDRADAADTLVSILINNDESPEDIRQAFAGDSDVKRALEPYLDEDLEFEDEDDYDELNLEDDDE